MEMCHNISSFVTIKQSMLLPSILVKQKVNNNNETASSVSQVFESWPLSADYQSVSKSTEPTLKDAEQTVALDLSCKSNRSRENASPIDNIVIKQEIK